VLPCSSFGEGIGSLLTQSFDEIYSGEAASYWREKRFLPPACRSCPDADVCGGACPLYWDAAGSFAELPRPDAEEPEARRSWEEGRAAGRSFGVAAPGR
jgi:radical SAM protein with 4Fe4S-binding SPASM domain